MIKRWLRRIILKERANSEAYVSWMKKQGAQIGNDVTVYAPRKTEIDMTCPWLLRIGNHVRIAQGVIILTHDYSWSVLKKYHESLGRILGAQSPVTIGNNVFIGMNAIITRGVTIGDNVIIGAGSVVTRNCESDSVYAGNPATKIMSVVEYLHKREKLQFEEAKQMVKTYFNLYGTRPPKEAFKEYFMLFCNADEAIQTPVFNFQMMTGNGFAESETYMKTHAPQFDSFDAFIDACLIEE